MFLYFSNWIITEIYELLEKKIKKDNFSKNDFLTAFNNTTMKSSMFYRYRILHLLLISLHKGECILPMKAK